MSSSSRETGSVSYSDDSPPCAIENVQMTKDNVDGRGFQAFLIDQLAKVQEQNEGLLSRITRLEKEQEEYYLCGQKKMEVGFKNVAKCADDVAAMKEVFKEIVGIMTGERVKFVDHSEESVTNEEAERVSSSTLLASNSRIETRDRARQYRSDYAALLGHSGVKMEESENSSRLLHGRRNSDANRFPDTNAHTQEMSRDHNIADSDNELNDVGIEDIARDEAFVPPNPFTTSNGFLPGSVPNYKMNRAIQSVHDVAREYFEGLPGRPSLMFLERRYGSTWRRSAKERTLFAKRMCIIHKINDIKDNSKKYGLPEKLHRNQAIKVVENIRLGNNNFKGHNCRLSVSQLYTYFSKKMDKIGDYSLDLKTKGEPRRNHLMRERMARLEQEAADSGNAEPSIASTVITTSSSDSIDHL